MLYIVPQLKSESLVYSEGTTLEDYKPPNVQKSCYRFLVAIQPNLKRFNQISLPEVSYWIHLFQVVPKK